MIGQTTPGGQSEDLSFCSLTDISFETSQSAFNYSEANSYGVFLTSMRSLLEDGAIDSWRLVDESCPRDFVEIRVSWPEYPELLTKKKYYVVGYVRSN